jgi:hypothetical protein
MDIHQPEFRWSVPVDGFEWRQTADSDDTTRIDTFDEPRRRPFASRAHGNVLVPRSGSVRTYAPLREFPGLFMTFALDTPATEDGIIAFANRFGTFRSADSRGPGYVELVPWATNPIRVETIDTWEWPHSRFHIAVRLWRFWRSEPSRAAIIEAFEWTPEGPIYPRSPDLGVRRRMIFGPVEQSMVDSEWLYRSFAYVITSAVREFGIFHLSMAERPPGRLRTELVPDSLLAAMWRQFATAIDLDKRFERCALQSCERGWFEISTDQYGLQPTARFCSNACKQKAYRERKQQKGRR